MLLKLLPCLENKEAWWEKPCGWYDLQKNDIPLSALRNCPNGSIKNNLYPIWSRRYPFFHWSIRDRKPCLKMLNSNFINMSRHSTGLELDSIMKRFISVKPQNITCHIGKYLKLWQSIIGVPRELSGEMINLIQSNIEENLNTEESNGQKEWRQTTLAKIQSKNKCYFTKWARANWVNL